MDISSIVGTDTILIKIKGIIDSEQKCSVQISGPEGSGKSWIAEKIEEYAFSQEYACIYLAGDREMDYESFYPLKKFVERRDAIFNKGRAAVTESLEEIPYVGKGIKVLLKGYDFRKQKLRRTINEISPFNKNLSFSLHLIGLLRKYRRVIIVCDDIEYFDTATADYLSFLKEGFLELEIDCNLTFITTSKDPNKFLSFFGQTYSLLIPFLEQAQAKKVIEYWSNRKISDDEFGNIYSCTGNHLQLIKIVAHYLIENYGPEPNRNYKDFLIWVIESRLRLAKDKYERFKNIILAVYQAGRKTSMHELLCLISENRDLKDLIHQAIQMNIFILKDNYIHFTHPIVESYALSLKSNKSGEFYEQLAICTRKLTPADYSRRAIIEQMGKQDEGANIYWALASIQRLQQGLKEEAKIITGYVTDTILGNELKEALAQFELAYEYSLKGTIDKAIIETELISNSLPKLLIAEKFFLKCQNLAKRISDEPKKEALRIIAQWEELKDQEPEIWYRFMQLKIIIAAELYQYDQAQNAEAEIVKFFSSRLLFDKQARLILEKLNSFSEVIYSPEIAHKKMIQSEERLSKYVLSEQYHLLSDLYIARTNLSSNSFMIDNFEKSIHYATSVISLIRTYPEFGFPYPEVAYNNLYLSLLFSDFSQLPIIVNQYEELHLLTVPQENKILIDMNFAGLLLLSNRPDRAIEVLNKCDYIPEVSSDNHYYTYYYWSNHSLASFMVGDQEMAKINHAKLEEIVSKISPFLKKFYNLHYQIVKEIISGKQLYTFELARKFAKNKADSISGKVWERFKVGYLFTDMQIWTSS